MKTPNQVFFTDHSFVALQSCIRDQKQGFGRVIMEHIMAYLDKEAPQVVISRSWLMLMHYMKNLVLP
jgi:hypothetical protein